MDWQYLQSNIYGLLNWTPETFWNLSMKEFAAAIRGVIMVNKAMNEGTKKGLSNDDKSHLKELLQKDKERNA